MNNSMQPTTNKVVIVGAGYVGTTTAFALITGEVVSEIHLIDIDREKVEGEVMDLRDGLSFLRPVVISAGDYSICQEAQIIIITAGYNQQPGETRLDLTQKNVRVLEDVLSNILYYNQSPIIIIATNPVDILTYYAFQSTGLPQEQVIGSGTVLDSSRLRHALSRHCLIDLRNIHGYVIGEHGEGAVIVWSTFRIAGMELQEFCKLCSRGCAPPDDLHEEVTQAAYRIIQKKGATYYSIALALRRIVESIFRDENSILTVSSYVSDYYGINDICLSLPSIVSREGRKNLLPIPLDTEELKALQQTADKLKGINKTILYSKV